MAKALLGATGFVGQHLAAQTTFTHHFSRNNSREVYPGPYDLLICAAAPGAKWQANQQPEADQAAIAEIQQLLERTIAHQVVLISTVDVFAQPNQVDEASNLLPTMAQSCPYGRHRHQLEQVVQSLFANHLIVRLPALFGPNLRKNFMFDLLQQRPLAWTHPASTFQWYNIERLWQDIVLAMQLGIHMLHLTSEPLAAHTLAKKLFQRSMPSNHHLEPVHYDVRSKYASHWQHHNHYQWTRSQIFGQLQHFVEHCPRHHSPTLSP